MAPIPKEKLISIFEKFGQVDGTALGLAISSQLVGFMNGQIHVESEEGEGSRFWFTVDLPVQKNDEKRNRLATDIRVLVVDYNQVNRSIIEEQLDCLGSGLRGL